MHAVDTPKALTRSHTRANAGQHRELLLFAIFVGLARTANSDQERTTDNAMAVFAFFLFVLYAVFSACLFCFRHYVIGACGCGACVCGKSGMCPAHTNISHLTTNQNTHNRRCARGPGQLRVITNPHTKGDGQPPSGERAQRTACCILCPCVIITFFFLPFTLSYVVYVRGERPKGGKCMDTCQLTRL